MPLLNVSCADAAADATDAAAAAADADAADAADAAADAAADDAAAAAASPLTPPPCSCQSMWTWSACFVILITTAAVL